MVSPPGLPDGIFPYQNLQFWFVLRGLGMENSAKNLARFLMNVKFWERGFKYEKTCTFQKKLWYKFG
jgi:hypothetical protein